MKLTDVVDRINGNVDRFTTELEYYIGGEHFESNELEVTQKGLLKENLGKLGFKFHFAFQDRDVVFMARNPHLRKAGMVRFAGLCSDASYILRSKDETVLSQEYLAVMLQSDHFWDYCESHKVGSVNFANNWSSIANYEFELPTPEEQKEISDQVWAAYRLKQSYKKLLAATEEMVKSQFIEMFGNPLSSIQRYSLKKLGDCCELNPRRPNLSLKDTDKVSFVPMPSVSENGCLQDVTDEEYGKVKKGFTYFENGDVLFAKITPCMENGKGAIAEGLTNNIGMGSTEFHVLRPIEELSSPYWLLALTRLQIFRERARKNMTGTGGQKRVPANYLENFMVGLPPIEEQSRFENIYKQADKSGFDGRKSQFIEMFNDSPLVRLEDHIETQSGGTPNTKKSEYYDGGTIPWLSSGEVNQGYISSTEKYITEEGFENSAAKWVPKNSVVIAMYGATAGKVGFITIPLTTNQAVCALLPNDAFNPLYLYYAVSSQKNWMIAQCRGAAQPNISQGIIRSMEIPMPSLSEQMQFVNIIKQADKSGSVGLKSGLNFAKLLIHR